MIATSRITMPEETIDQNLKVKSRVTTIGNTIELKSQHLMPRVLKDLLVNHQTALPALVLPVLLINLKILMLAKIVDLRDKMDPRVDPLVKTKRNQCGSSQTIPTRPKNLLSVESLNFKLGAKLQFDRRAMVDPNLLHEEVVVFALGTMMTTPFPTKPTFLEQIVKKTFLKLTKRCCLMMTSSWIKSRKREVHGQSTTRRPTFSMICSLEPILEVFTHQTTLSKNF